MQFLHYDQLAESRVQRLMHFIEEEAEESGLDVLWEEVLRFFLKTGSPQYSHEASKIIGEYCPEP